MVLCGGHFMKPHDRDSLLKELREAKAELSEEQLRSYRDNVESL